MQVLPNFEEILRKLKKNFKTENLRKFPYILETAGKNKEGKFWKNLHKFGNSEKNFKKMRRILKQAILRKLFLYFGNYFWKQQCNRKLKQISEKF